MKFGEVLNSIKAGFDHMTSNAKSPNGGLRREDRNFDIHAALRKNLTDLVNQAKNSAEEIQKIEQLKFQAETIGRKDLAALYKRQLDKEIQAARKIEEERKKIEQEFEKVEKEIIENRVKGALKLKKTYGDLSNIEGDYTDKLKLLIEARSRGFITEEKYRKMASNLDYVKKAKQTLNLASQDGTSLVSSFINGIGNGLGSLISKILPAFGWLADGMVALFKKALDQMFVENDALIDVLRSTGGVVNANMIGYTAGGAGINGFSSLSTDVVRANVSLDDFKRGLSNLFDGPMGQIIGMRTSLQNSSQEMNKYALSAAKAMKLWGVDISGTVANLTMDYGLGVGQATDVTEAFMFSAKNLGLNMKFASKQLERVSSLSTKYYFRNVEQMTKMAMLATNLGVEVEGLLDGVNKMGSMTDLFTEQQKAAAYEMGSLANNMSKIYALNATGSEAEASRIKLLAAYTDANARGFYDRKGNTTAMGINTFKQMGFTKEEMDALQRIGKLQKMGVSAQAALNPAVATQMEKDKIKQYELENRSLSENLYMAVQEVIMPIVSFIKNLFEPIVIGFIKLLQHAADFVSPLFDLLGVLVNIFRPALAFVSGILQGIGEVFSVVGGWIKTAVSWIEKFVGKINESSGFFQKFGEVIGIAIASIIILEGLLLAWQGIMALVNIVTTAYAWIMKGQMLTSLRAFATMIIVEVIPALWKFIAGMMEGLIAFLTELGPAGWAVAAGMLVAGAAAIKFSTDLTKSDDKITNNHRLDDKVWSEIYKNDIAPQVANSSKGAAASVLSPIKNENTNTRRSSRMEHAWDLTKQQGYKQPVIVNNNIKVDGVISQSFKQTTKTGH